MNDSLTPRVVGRYYLLHFIMSFCLGAPMGALVAWAYNAALVPAFDLPSLAALPIMLAVVLLKWLLPCQITVSPGERV